MSDEAEASARKLQKTTIHFLRTGLYSLKVQKLRSAVINL